MAKSPDIHVDLLRRIARGTVLSVPVLGAYVEQVVFGTLDDKEKREKAAELRRIFASVAQAQHESQATIESVLEAVLKQAGQHQEVSAKLDQVLATVRASPERREAGGPGRPTAVPSVFISSTIDDLKSYRSKAEGAATRAEFLPILSDYFPASQDRTAVTICQDRAAAADVLVAIVGHRYGWVPPENNKDERSITWLECEAANTSKKQVLAFLVDDGFSGLDATKEQQRLIEALSKGEDITQIAAEVQRNVRKLSEFRDWLSSHERKAIRKTFTTPDNLEFEVYYSLEQWRKRNSRFVLTLGAPQRAPSDPTPYLEYVRNANGYIRIRGLHVGSAKVHSFPIDELYVPLTTSQPAGQRAADAPTDEVQAAPRARIELEEALQQRRLVIVGDPGAGKTTFLRRVAYELALTRLEVDPGAAMKRLGLRDPLLPIYIRMGDLTKHRAACRERNKGPTLPNSPAWLLHFLEAQSKDHGWNLDEQFFRETLQEGGAMVLLDGLDEAPDRKERELIAEMFEKAVADFGTSRFVVTTRPRAYQGVAVLANFEEVRIEPLEPDAVETFLRQWSKGIFPNSETDAEAHRAELSGALEAKPEISRMARNPVMLTALAALYWNDKRLPDQRAELYESILTWLLRSREERPGRVGEKVARRRLSQLALAMQTHPEGRQTQLARYAAAETIADQFEGDVDAAEAFLAEEEIDSGVITSVGHDVRFWHLTFQEYLAAREIEGKADLGAQVALLTESERIYQPEWRETALLFAGVLHDRGVDKVNAFFSALLDELGKDSSLKEKARFAGLLGAIVRDLSPLKYVPSDPRYRETLNAVMEIFDAEKSGQVPLWERLEAADALGLAGDPRLRLPSDPDYWVKIGEFEIGRFPVTVHEYKRFVDDGRPKPGEWEEQLQRLNCPVTRVSWHDAKAYCDWAGVRLLTDPERQQAARGEEGREYPWGNEEPDVSRANYSDTRLGKVSPVGLFPRGSTPDGIADMAGNVWEWVADRFSKNEEKRVVRGGSWSYFPDYLGVSYRLWVLPDYRYDDRGFRCAREVSP